MANNDITYVRPEVRAAMPVWKKIRDVCKGADAVEAANIAQGKEQQTQETVKKP